ncbi:MAG TPA: cation diffusion facilitator family transporter [Verrucomicrobiae bacterium]|jgi:cobalt-zinc-cadmium efflux system protein|nr:cation diffusion facilitator family transporter [Verrucomicrobiae bacterium]
MSHSHSHGLHAAGKGKRLLLVFSLTSVYMLAEIIGGILTKSLALLADAGHMLTDAAALGLALLAIWFAGRPATEKKTYGFYRMEILAAFINALVLLGISFFILYEAWRRFENPPEIQSKQMLIVAAFGLAVNLVSMAILHEHSEHSLNVKGAYLEVLSDMLGSIGVILASVIMLLTHWYYADPLISAGIGIFILPRTWNLLNEAAHILMEGTPAHIDLRELQAAIQGVKGVKSIHDLHVWTITSGVDAMSSHIAIDNTVPGERVLSVLRELLRDKFKIHHSTIQLEAESEQCKEPGCQI